MELPVNDRSVRHPLVCLGFSSDLQQHFLPYQARGLLAGRVAAEHRAGHVLLTESGEVFAEVSGRLHHATTSRAELPAVGDWVAFLPEKTRGAGSGMNIHSGSTHRGDLAVIHAVLPRRTAFVRAAAGGTTEPQVVAANVDVVVIVCALGQDLNLRRIERYLAVTRASGAEAVVALTKADLHPSVGVLDEVRSVTGACPVHVVSSVTGAGLDGIRALVADGRTLALVGSSGVGKSTLLNRLASADAQSTAPLGADGRGRHTTTHRELFVLPDGGLVLDTPGMRELRLWNAEDALDETFADVAALAAECRFGDCAHDAEPGCAVVAALDRGSLSAARWASYDKLQREQHALARRQDARLAAEDRRRIKVFSRAARVRDRNRGRGG
jgi:ribosome biogenesis GTPase